MKKCGVIGWIAFAFTVAGAINWGLLGLFQIDLVQLVFANKEPLAKATYIVIGIAGVYTLIGALRCCGKKE